jgi:hypothetical protein
MEIRDNGGKYHTVTILKTTERTKIEQEEGKKHRKIKK